MSKEATGDFPDSEGAYIPERGCKLILKAADKYVSYDSASGLYSPLPSAMLSSDPKEDATSGQPRIVADEEQDISKRLADAPRATYTLSIGVAWDTGEMSGLFCFRDSILEYRKNIGIESNKVNPITGTRPCYMKTYASIGIPLARYNWLVKELEKLGINASHNTKDVETNNYVWFNANITKNFTPYAMVRSRTGVLTVLSEGKRNISSMLRRAKRNIIGIAGVEITLKRSPDFTLSGQRIITLSFKAFQVIDITDISSPPLNRTVCFVATEDQISARLRDVLNTTDGDSAPRISGRLIKGEDSTDTDRSSRKE